MSYLQNTIVPKLEQRLLSDLPGFESHLKMAPVFKGTKFRNFNPTIDAKSSAVMILLMPIENSFEILFTLRSEKLNNHSGQISFPGGRQDKGETLVETALRETKEEIGINPENIKIIGSLSNLFVPPSNSIIAPIIGYSDKISNFILSENEVQEVFTIEYNKFISKDFFFKETKIMNGLEVEVPYWNLHPKTKLWGATAIIMQEFIDVVNDL